MKQSIQNVKEKIAILAVAPYEGIKTLIEKEAKAYSNVTIDTVVGNLQEGVRLAQSNFHFNYDAIISRGGTAEALREHVEIPVIEIPILNNDLLKVIRLSEEFNRKKAIVGFSSITNKAKSLCDILQINIDIFTLVEENDIYPIISQLEKDDYQIILCDVISGNIAKARGLSTILITSSPESINIAISDAIKSVYSRKSLLNDNLLLRTLLNECTEDTVLYDSNKTLCFSSIKISENEKIITYLESLITEVINTGSRHYTKSIDGLIVTIKSIIIESANKNYVAFFFTKNKTTKVRKLSGINFYSMKELEQQFLDSFYTLTGNIDQNKHNIRQINTTNVPIIIQGETGTGKTELANYIYINSNHTNHSLVEIDCDSLSNKTKNFLLNSPNSPLYYFDHMIHFKNMEANTETFMKDLLSTISHIGVCRNNKVIFSDDHSQLSNPFFILYLKDKFQCIEIELKPIRENKEQIPAIANLYINHQNIKYGKDVLRLDKNAMSLLTEYPWPNNYVQLERILSQLVITSRDHIIRESDVRNILSLEKIDVINNSKFDNIVYSNKTLLDIERDIIKRILKENNNNQSIVAKKLAISRTTLWRILKEN